jgi:hypothetical protein
MHTGSVCSEENLVRLIARNTARAEALLHAGAISSAEHQLLVGNLYAARTEDQVAMVASRLDTYPPARVKPLEENPTRLALASFDCYLERQYPESYAGFRFVEGGTLVEFGFVTELRQRVAEVRRSVAITPRVSGFAAQFSLVELLYAKAMVRRAWAELREQMPLRMSTLSEARNAVVIGVETDVAECQELLRARFGPAVIAEQSYGAAPA